MKAYLFYGTQLVGELDTANQSASRIKAIYGQEIYDGGWVYTPWIKGQPYEWWRCDMTPVRVEHVPKELRALALLIT